MFCVVVMLLLGGCQAMAMVFSVVAMVLLGCFGRFIGCCQAVAGVSCVVTRVLLDGC